jgi:uncharacterized protein YggT (Ycf19 family)
MQDVKVDVGEDEARQAAQQEAVRSSVESRVNAEVSRRANAVPADQDRLDRIAADVRERAVDNTARSERVLGEARTAARASQFVDYAFGIVYTLLLIRLLLGLIAASSSNGFVQFIRTVTNPLYAPFRGIVPSPTADGGYTLAVPVMIAIAVYAILHVAINGLLRMVGERKTAV